ncbi:MAG: hypothetical protein HEP71_02690 [Roseivirga sp.]|nr:hypothetical protein [Roseivirga sp.]
MKKVWNHLKEDWYKYLIEVGVVVFSILLAFELDKWSQNQSEKEELKDTYHLIVEEIKWDLEQVDSILVRIERARPYFDKFIAGTLTSEEYKACNMCKGLATSRYPIKSSNNGWKNLIKEPHFQISPKDTLNHTIDDYYYDLNVRAAKEMEIMGADIMENIKHFKFNAPAYYKLDSDPLAMMNFHLESAEYKNMLSIRRYFLYERYLVTLKGLKTQGTKALSMIARKYPVG